MFYIDCPFCHVCWVSKGETLINDEFEPLLKNSVCDESFFKRKCGSCGEIIQFSYPTMYHFPKKQIIVALDHDELTIEGQDVYLAQSIPSFYEYIRIVRAGLNIININKLKSDLHQYKYLCFESFENEHLFFQSDRGVIAIKNIST